jgi:dTMP kinase
VVLEGIDGAGKTEQTRRLVAWLRERGERVLETREPTDGKWGQRYRAWAQGDSQAEPQEVLRFFVEDRREHVSDVMRPALEAGTVVVCDRYVASTLAYQAAQGLDRDFVRKRVGAERLPEPDLVLWLRLPVDQALARLGPDAGERFERAAFLGRVDAEYARLGLEEIDASASLDVVARAIQDRVQLLLKGR